MFTVRSRQLSKMLEHQLKVRSRLVCLEHATERRVGRVPIARGLIQGTTVDSDGLGGGYRGHGVSRCRGDKGLPGSATCTMRAP